MLTIRKKSQKQLLNISAIRAVPEKDEMQFDFGPEGYEFHFAVPSNALIKSIICSTKSLKGYSEPSFSDKKFSVLMMDLFGRSTYGVYDNVLENMEYPVNVRIPKGQMINCYVINGKIERLEVFCEV